MGSDHPCRHPKHGGERQGGNEPSNGGHRGKIVDAESQSRVPPMRRRPSYHALHRIVFAHQLNAEFHVPHRCPWSRTSRDFKGSESLNARVDDGSRNGRPRHHPEFKGSESLNAPPRITANTDTDRRSRDIGTTRPQAHSIVVVHPCTLVSIRGKAVCSTVKATAVPRINANPYTDRSSRADGHAARTVDASADVALP